MRAQTQLRPAPSPHLGALLLLFGLHALAVSQSVYSMLEANPDFLGARLSNNSQLLGIVAVFSLFPPFALFLLWLALHQRNRRLAQSFLGFVTAGLLLVFFWQAQNIYLGEEWHSLWFAYWVWLVPAGLLGLMAARSPQGVRSFAFVAAPIALVFSGLFLARTWSTHIEMAATAQHNLQQAVARARSSDRPAVFFLLFDELSLPLLLSEDGKIDAAAYPHFSELARGSYWFRQATANADFTNNSLPTILTGNFPRRVGLTQQAYPDNLFALVEPHYELFVYETWSKFCRPDRYHCLRDSDRLEASDAALFLDIFYLFAARVVPRGAHWQVADVRKNWGFFHNPRVAVELALRRFAKFQETIAKLESPAGAFVFFHNSLPHSPYWVTTDGAIREVEPAAFDFAQRGHAQQVQAVLDHYREQVTFVDAELGQFLDLLKHRGLYDASLVIVTSDHGVSFDTRAPGRDLVVEDGRALNAEPLLRVPLFIKLPDQQAGAVSDREAQLIDIMPTVAEVLSLDVPWRLAGRSVFSPDNSPRDRIVYDRKGHGHRFSSDPRLGWQVSSQQDPKRAVTDE